MKVAIVGAGIGGLTAAIALQRVGVEPHVFERANGLRSGGSGIILQPNAMMVVRELGLLDAVESIGAVLGPGRMLNDRGQLLQEVDLRSVVPDAPAGIGLHRHELTLLLLDALDGEVRFGAHVTEAKNTGGGAAIRVDDELLEFDAVIGCDGRHSSVRASLRGDEPLRYAGYTTWRGVAEDFDVGHNLTEVWGGRLRFGLVPLSRGRAYWFAVETAPAGGTDGPDTRKLLAEKFRHFPNPVHDVIVATADDGFLRTDVFDRPPINDWTDGHFALLGDAAHPMTPNLGQGAGQAIEDALALANAFDRHEGVPAALTAYANCRRKRANWFVNQSWTFGKMAQVENSLMRSARDLTIRMTPDAVTRRSMEQIYTPVTAPD